ncbi:hypothetical protein ACFRCI_21195 [Streptomyces sp. NPDC056638]|uniref:hypothetical protein n=1 Tax=Streptomyces sp. NPDC056638 TaxID=3345887 RepID=UPI0036AB62CA
MTEPPDASAAQAAPGARTDSAGVPAAPPPSGATGPRAAAPWSATARATAAGVIGQLWGLTVIVDAWMEGNTGTSWWGAGFLCLFVPRRPRAACS